MSKQTLKKGVMLLVVAGMLSLGSNGAENGGSGGGCATGAGSAGAGAAIGAITGGIIGHQRGRAWEGAAIGATLGAITGFVIDDIQQRQVETREEVEQQRRADGKSVPTEPTVELNWLASDPQSTEPGEEVTVSGEYSAFGSDQMPTGQYRIYQDGELIADRDVAEQDLQLEYAGKSEFDIPIRVPLRADGTYEVEVELINGESRDKQRTQFTVT